MWRKRFPSRLVRALVAPVAGVAPVAVGLSLPIRPVGQAAIAKVPCSSKAWAKVPRSPRATGRSKGPLLSPRSRSAGAKVPCSRRRRIGRAGRCLPTGDGRRKADDPSVEMSSKDRSISTTGGCEADASERPRGEAGEGAEYGWDGFECPTWTTFRWERGFCVGPHSRLPSSIACADARAISPHSARPRTAFRQPKSCAPCDRSGTRPVRAWRVSGDDVTDTSARHGA